MEAFLLGTSTRLLSPREYAGNLTVGCTDVSYTGCIKTVSVRVWVELVSLYERCLARAYQEMFDDAETRPEYLVRHLDCPSEQMMCWMACRPRRWSLEATAWIAVKVELRNGRMKCPTTRGAAKEVEVARVAWYIL